MIAACGAACIAHHLHADAVSCARYRGGLACRVIWIGERQCGFVFSKGRVIVSAKQACPSGLFKLRA